MASRAVFRLCLVFAASLLLAAPVLSDVEVTREDRDRYLQAAEVWQQPAWFDANLELIAGRIDIAAGPPPPAAAVAWLQQPSPECQFLPDDSPTGKSPKFDCQPIDPATGELLVTADGKPLKVKVKYFVEGNRFSREVFSEVAATRMLWALGFGADRLYPLARITCRGCPRGPHLSLDKDFGDWTFHTVAAEFRMDGEEIARKGGEGWAFDELERATGASDEETERKLMQRNALKLVAALLQHHDSKSSNNRLVCLSDATKTTCSGAVGALIHDVGTTFGGGAGILKLSKFEFEKWAEKPIWREPNGVKRADCVANLTRSPFTGDPDLMFPPIREDSRRFAGRLLEQLFGGENGKARAIALFTTARFDRSGYSPEHWAAALAEKIVQINSGPSCPSRDDETQRPD